MVMPTLTLDFEDEPRAGFRSLPISIEKVLGRESSTSHK
jgi:hypothetical protein